HAEEAEAGVPDGVGYRALRRLGRVLAVDVDAHAHLGDTAHACHCDVLTWLERGRCCHSALALAAERRAYLLCRCRHRLGLDLGEWPERRRDQERAQSDRPGADVKPGVAG